MGCLSTTSRNLTLAWAETPNYARSIASAASDGQMHEVSRVMVLSVALLRHQVHQSAIARVHMVETSF